MTEGGGESQRDLKRQRQMRGRGAEREADSEAYEYEGPLQWFRRGVRVFSVWIYLLFAVGCFALRPSSRSAVGVELRLARIHIWVD